MKDDLLVQSAVNWVKVTLACWGSVMDRIFVFSQNSYVEANPIGIVFGGGYFEGH